MLKNKLSSYEVMQMKRMEVWLFAAFLAYWSFPSGDLSFPAVVNAAFLQNAGHHHHHPYKRCRSSVLLPAAASPTSMSSQQKPENKAVVSSSRRIRFLNRIGFRRTSNDNFALHQAEATLHASPPKHLSAVRPPPSSTPVQYYNISTLDALEQYWQDPDRVFRKGGDNSDDINYNQLLKRLNVQGDTQVIGSVAHREYTHPVVQLLHERRKRQQQQQQQQGSSSSKAGEGLNNNATAATFKCKVALAIEGGGMRGCISAGMVCALHHLNLTSSLDVVYGSSAGTIVGAYLITGQLPWFGPEVYYDCLTTAGKQFIDTGRLLRALGFGLLDPRLFRDVLTRPSHGKPVLNLSYLLKKTVQQTKPIDWATFVQQQKVLPLKVVASGCKSEKALVLDMEGNAFNELSELADCMHASCLLPGIAGPLMNLDTRALKSKGQLNTQKLVLGNNLQGDHYEPLADALLFEPLPYRSAIKEGSTHVLVLRSRPDGTDVTGKGGVFEQLIFRRFFLRKNRLPNMFERLRMQLHKKLYAEDIITLNEAAWDTRSHHDTTLPHLMTIALEPGSKEISRLETDRAAIFDGLRRGFARAYDCLVEDPAERGKGSQVARQYFPDEILDYDPQAIQSGSLHESAFSIYLREQGIEPKAWENARQLPTEESQHQHDSDPTLGAMSTVRL